MSELRGQYHLQGHHLLQHFKRGPLISCFCSWENDNNTSGLVLWHKQLVGNKIFLGSQSQLHTLNEEKVSYSTQGRHEEVLHADLFIMVKCVSPCKVRSLEISLIQGCMAIGSGQVTQGSSSGSSLHKLYNFRNISLPIEWECYQFLQGFVMSI